MWWVLNPNTEGRALFSKSKNVEKLTEKKNLNEGGEQEDSNPEFWFTRLKPKFFIVFVIFIHKLILFFVFVFVFVSVFVITV